MSALGASDNEQHNGCGKIGMRSLESIMPKTKLENFIFTLLMAFVMVYGMVCYNIALALGGMSNAIFVMALQEMVIMWPVAVVLEFFVVEKLAQMLAFRMVTPGKDKPVVIVLAISTMIVCLMCPMMSLVATVLFKHAGMELVAVWAQTTVLNFPMALGWQLVVAGPFVRWVFSLLFAKKNAEAAASH